MALNERQEQAQQHLDEIYGLTSWEERKQAAENNSSSDWRERAEEKKRQVHNDMRRMGIIPWEERKQAAENNSSSDWIEREAERKRQMYDDMRRMGFTPFSEKKAQAEAAKNNTLQTVSYAETSYNNADNEKPSVIAAFLPMIVLLTLIVLVSKFLKHKEKSVHYTQNTNNIFGFLKNELGVSAFVIVGISAIFQLI